MKKILCVFISIFLICSPTLVLADTGYKVVVNENEISVDIPDDFLVLTEESLNNPNEDFADMPISKNDAIELFKTEGVVLDAFSKEHDREIKVKVSSDSFSEQIVNLTPLDEYEQQQVLDALAAGVGETQWATVLDKAIVEQDGYTFLKYSVRIGDPQKGYCYTSMMTIINKTYYEFTCYNSNNLITDEHYEEHDDFFSSIRLDIKNNSGEITTNRLTSIFAIVAIIAAALVIVSLVYSLVKYAYKKHNEPDKVTLTPRE